MATTVCAPEPAASAPLSNYGSGPAFPSVIPRATGPTFSYPTPDPTAVHRTNAARDLLAEEVAFKIIKEGVRTEKMMSKRGVLVYEYRLPSGYGAYFDAATDKFITFIEPQK